MLFKAFNLAAVAALLASLAIATPVPAVDGMYFLILFVKIADDGSLGHALLEVRGRTCIRSRG